MKNDITKRWIEAAKILGINPNENILCPVCQQSFLKVQDVKNENNPLEIERHMNCELCGAYNALRINLTNK